MIDTGAGVVDADYRGSLLVLLFNFSDQPFQGSLSSNGVRAIFDTHDR